MNLKERIITERKAREFDFSSIDELVVKTLTCFNEMTINVVVDPNVAIDQIYTIGGKIAVTNIRCPEKANRDFYINSLCLHLLEEGLLAKTTANAVRVYLK